MCLRLERIANPTVACPSQARHVTPANNFPTASLTVHIGTLFPVECRTTTILLPTASKLRWNLVITNRY